MGKKLRALFLSLLFILAYATPLFAEITPQDSQTVQSAWGAILGEQIKSLNQIDAEAASFLKNLPQLTADLNTKVEALQSEFLHLMTIAQINRSSPPDLSVVMELTRRQQEELATYCRGIDNAINRMDARFKELALLSDDAQDVSSQELANFRMQLAATDKKLAEIKSRMVKALAPAHRLSWKMHTLQNRLKLTMPQLWSSYYLDSIANYDTSLQDSLAQFDTYKNIMTLRLATELPDSIRQWITLFLRTGLILFLGSVLAFFAMRYAKNLPEDLYRGIKRIALHSYPWLLLSLSLLYACMWEKNLFQMLTSCAILFLVWGQLNLVWDIYAIKKEDIPKRNPLASMAFPMLCGIVLLYLEPFPLLLSSLWSFVLASTLFFVSRRAKPTSRLTHYLLMGYVIILWLSLFGTLLGYARLSVLVSVVYTGMAVALQQIFALLDLGKTIDAILPKEGMSGLLNGLALAFFLPMLMFGLSLIPALWVLAYPGGDYLLAKILQTGISIGSFSLNIMQVLVTLMAFYLTRSCITVGTTFLAGLRKQGFKLSPTLIGPFQTAFTYSLWAIFGFFVLNAFGFSLTNLAIVAGGLSVGLGFGLQNIVQNFISGLMVIFGQIVREGDIVEVAGTLGTVRRVNIRSTQVETYDNAVVFIPNSEFLSQRFTNWTHNGRRVRREIKVGIAYGSDVSLAMKLLSDIALAHPRVLHWPEPAVLFWEFGGSSLEMLLRFWIGDIDHGLATMTDLRLAIDEKFAEHGINIAFPQLDVHFPDEDISDGKSAILTKIGGQEPS